MRRSWILLVVPGGLAVLAAVLVVALLLIKLMWGWTVPELFPEAVKQNLVAGTISWWTSLKLAVFIALLAAVAGICRRR